MNIEKLCTSTHKKVFITAEGPFSSQRVERVAIDRAIAVCALCPFGIERCKEEFGALAVDMTSGVLFGQSLKRYEG